MSKEQIHDEQIEPLMSQVIAICQANGIAMIASFHIPTDENPMLACTSMIPDGDGNNGPEHVKAARALGAPV